MYELAVFAVANNLSLHNLEIISLDAVSQTIWRYAFMTVSVGFAAPVMCLTVGTEAFGEWVLALVPDTLTRLLLLFVIYTLALFPLFQLQFVMLWREEDRHQRELVELKHILDNFSVARLRCTVEADRAFVEGEIIAHFGSFAPFERFVKEALRPTLVTQFGLIGVTYPMFLAGQIPHIIAGLDGFLFSWLSRSAGQTAHALSYFNFWTVGFCFVYIPIGLKGGYWLFGKVRQSKMLTDQQKPVAAMMLANLWYSMCIAAAILLAIPNDIPQPPCTVVLILVAFAVWRTW